MSVVRNLNYCLNLPYVAIVVKDKNFDDTFYYYAYYKEYEYIKGAGNNEAEAISDLKSAFKDALAQMLSDNEYYYEKKYNARDRCRRKRARHFSFDILGYFG